MRISKSVTGSHRLNVAQNLGSRTTHSDAKAVNSTTYADDWMTGQLRSPTSAKRRREGRAIRAFGQSYLQISERVV